MSIRTGMELVNNNKGKPRIRLKTEGVVMINELLQKYIDLLKNTETSENELQTFFEANTELIPLPYLDNHHLHMNTIISKLPLRNEFVTDFAYLTKSSDFWDLVLIELESNNKKLFKGDNQNIRFTAEFNNAYEQVLSWRSYIEGNKNSVISSLEKIRVPLAENDVRFKYVLIIGRNNEKDQSEKRRKMFSQKSRDDIIVMTYDSVISHYQCHQDSRLTKLVLSPWGNKGFSIKAVPSNLNTTIFAYMFPDYLKISDKEDIEKLKGQGYCMDSWFEGKPLAFNEKYASWKQLAEDNKHSLIQAMAESEEE